MDFFDQIPQSTKDMVHVFAAQGKAPEEIGFLTHLNESAVARILAQPATVELQAVIAELTQPTSGAVNTTPDKE